MLAMLTLAGLALGGAFAAPGPEHRLGPDARLPRVQEVWIDDDAFVLVELAPEVADRVQVVSTPEGASLTRPAVAEGKVVVQITLPKAMPGEPIRVWFVDRRG